MGETAPEAPVPTPAAPVTATATVEPPAPVPPTAGPFTDEFKSEESKQAVLKNLTDERDRRKAAEQQAKEIQSKSQAQLDAIAKALGFKEDDAPPNPEVLQRTLSEREAHVSGLEQTLADRDKEIAAWRAAAKQGVNTLALLDSRSFLSDIAQLDHTADDFTTRLDAAVKTAVTNNPVLRATAVRAADAGIGVSGAGRSAADVAPGMARLREAYSNTSTH